MGQFSGKKVLVLGLGVHGGGLGVARFMVGQGAQVRVTDMKDALALAGSLKQLEGLPIEYALGGHRAEDIEWADLIVRNPAIPRESEWLALARQLGKPIEMELSLFAQLCPAPIIGVTGTKGKTTTATWTWEMARRHWPDAVLAGNMRIPALEQLPNISAASIVVLEMSSWQLEGLADKHWSPPYAGWTNMSPDHLNRYRDMQDYAEAKFEIIRYQRPESSDTAVLNYDDALVRSFAANAPARVVWFATGDTLPQTPCAFLDGEKLLWRTEDGREELLAMSGDLRVPGKHNRANALCAAGLALSAGATLDEVRAGLLEFWGVPDRLELVATINGVNFYNDTTATTPAATVAALEALAEPVVLLAGGADKRLEFGDMAALVAQRTKAVALLEGTATDKLQAALEHHEANIIIRADDFERAVRAAFAAATPGDAVLLSPGCASFGMFLNEFDRGEKFRGIVSRIKGDECKVQSAKVQNNG